MAHFSKTGKYSVYTASARNHGGGLCQTECASCDIADIFLITSLLLPKSQSLFYINKKKHYLLLHWAVHELKGKLYVKLLQTRYSSQSDLSYKANFYISAASLPAHILKWGNAEFVLFRDPQSKMHKRPPSHGWLTIREANSSRRRIICSQCLHTTQANNDGKCLL